MAVPRAQIQKLYAGPDLVVLNAIWAPGMSVPPHNHNMWAVIGLYDGREDNIFWRRIGDAPDGRIEAAGAKALSTGECTTLGPDIIHSVINPSARLSGALHVYGGDFVNVARSQWDADTLREGPFNAEMATRVFEEASRRATG